MQEKLEKYGKNAPWHTTRKTDRERDLAWLISSSVHQTVIELVPKRKKGRGPRYFSGCLDPPAQPSPPLNTPYKLDVVFNFFEWTLVRRQSQTNNQAICGKANSSLDATLVISAAALLEVNSLGQFLSCPTDLTTNSETTY